MTLPQTDLDFLESRDINHEIVSESGMTCVVLREWELPSAFDAKTADLLLRLAPGYPDVAPDMWWFDPPARLSNGSRLPNTDVSETYLDRTWQRWSRHLTPDQWRSGVDGLETFVALIRQELHRSVPAAVR